MGWGAAYAFFEENPEAWGSVEDAYDALYGDRHSVPRCPICRKKIRGGEHGMKQHTTAKHPNRAMTEIKARDEGESHG